MVFSFSTKIHTFTIMANAKLRLPQNVPGEFFVDSTCINCDTCRQLAPEVFDESDDDYSFVRSQPDRPEVGRMALRALLACPTGSIGTVGDNQSKRVMSDFPLLLDSDVYYCGFASQKSFGGSSYFIRHPDGNWLIDSPKFIPHLVRQFEERGGLSYIFLTHRDDVADADRYAKHFGAKRIIHRKELSAQPDAERILDGDEPVNIARDFLAIPTPGHTRGHCALLFRNSQHAKLFTGDHLWWSRLRRQLYASESVCWYDWEEQQRSLKRLLKFDFDWILPGHGERYHGPMTEVRVRLEDLISSLSRNGGSWTDGDIQLAAVTS
jgi:glyoxylase-like metal-dependent hydrolase (beta-lactamase superfamily II)/ferredoxin